MSGEIKINHQELISESLKLKQAITQFEPFTARFTEKTVSRLEGFNSDFIKSLEKTLKNMADDTGPELLETIKDFSQKVESVADQFQTLDKELAN